MDVIIKRLDDLERLMKSCIFQKEVLTFSEGCAYCGYSHSYMYKLISYYIIPYYKTHQGRVFFRRSDLDEWLLHCRVVFGKETNVYQNKERRNER
jgi:excisionase family DNA binding protein